MRTTERLRLVRPSSRHVDALFAAASDAEITRWVGWPRHASKEDTRSFLAFSEAEWERAAAGPLVIEGLDSGQFLGTTGLAFEQPRVASTGYVLRREAWGRGFATEALRGVADLARDLSVIRLFAHCHPEHRASARVLEKAEFQREGLLRRSMVFPNLDREELQDTLIYARILDPLR